jgi:2-hydroxycyclohexanecarboxyl-CoA dehydrogenase
MFELTGKVAVVTGGARGLGRGISMTLARQGAKVAISDLLTEEAEKTVQDIERDGGQATAVKTDVTDLNSVNAMLDHVHAVFGPVDILVNNAGWDKMLPFSKTTPQFWDKVIAINYKGVLNCVYAIMGDMVERNSGKIVSIASDAGRVGSSGEAVYSGAKGAVIAFSKTIARELARNKINVNVVCPGPSETPLVQEMKQESDFAVKVFASMDKIIPLRRLGVPQDVANAVVFLASEEASFITGQVLSVSGGLTMM